MRFDEVDLYFEHQLTYSTQKVTFMQKACRVIVLTQVVMIVLTQLVMIVFARQYFVRV